MAGGTPDETDDDLILRALVQLTESQNQRIEGLRRAVFDLQAQLQARRDTDVLLAHEIRTPLTVVTGVLSTLEAGVDPALAAELVSRGLSQAEHLADVVDDLLHPSSVGGAMFPRALLKEARFADLVDQSLDAVETRYPGFVGTVTAHVAPRDLVVATAPSRIVAVLVNLLENAAKYADGAAVEITAHVDAERDLVVEVADGGPGVHVDTDAQQLFSAFTRGANARGSTKPGRGVGLYLVRNLVRSLGGDITLGNRHDGRTGAVARFHLPQRRAEDPASRTVTGTTRTVTAGDASR